MVTPTLWGSGSHHPSSHPSSYPSIHPSLCTSKTRDLFRICQVGRRDKYKEKKSSGVLWGRQWRNFHLVKQKHSLKTWRLWRWRYPKITPLKMNIAPEKGPSQKENSSSNHHFSGAMLIFGGVSKCVEDTKLPKLFSVSKNDPSNFQRFFQVFTITIVWREG